jgi:hypothetical protein
MDSFSITLPSNVRSTLDPDNTPSKYTTRLLKPLELDGEWEVAATRLQYHHSWCNITKPKVLGVFFRNLLSTLPVSNTLALGNVPQEPVDHSMLQCMDESWAIGLKGLVHYRRVQVPVGYYESREALGYAVEYAIRVAFKQSGVPVAISMNQKYSLKVDAAKLMAAYESSWLSAYAIRIVQLDSADGEEDDIMELLGFSHTEAGSLSTSSGPYVRYKYYGDATFPTPATARAFSISDMYERYCGIITTYPKLVPFVSLRQLFLYTDIVSFRAVGDVQAQLLDTVIVGSKHDAYEDALRGTKPCYVAVSQQKIQSIEITLRDHTGEPLKFVNTYNPVVVTLHFRQRR